MGRRRTQRTDNTLRELLLKDWRERFGPRGRWHIPGHASDYEQALVAGEPVVVAGPDARRSPAVQLQRRMQQSLVG